MIKKIAALVGAGAILLSVAGPALAWNISLVDIENYAGALANTGGNSQGNYATAEGTYNSADAGSGSGARTMTTGSATAVAAAGVTVNTTLYDGYYCDWECFLPLNDSEVIVDNIAGASADTGGNSQNNSAAAYWYGNSADAGSGSGARTMTTGPAYSSAQAFTVVNTGLVWW